MFLKKTFFLLLLPLLSFCLHAQPSSGNSSVISRLDTMVYFPLCYNPDSIAEIFWKKGEGRNDLNTIVNDTTVSLRARFMAAEILFSKDASYPAGSDRQKLGDIYAQVLKKNMF